MRSGASVSQLFADNALPWGARITRVLSRRLAIVPSEVLDEQLGTDSGGNGAGADEIGGKSDVGRKIAVVVQMRDAGAQQRTRALEWRARRHGRVEVAA